ncbi:MAG TPA: HAMP domain-containing protein [Pseudonocardiaceae bacterium]|jgi:signal transduction histidine kinase/HAMP domain-containing protein/CheY-like chemotaxis protein|nr:HAMP domain-containing protein [Pseudonocardiaceae bacterium]
MDDVQAAQQVDEAFLGRLLSALEDIRDGNFRRRLRPPTGELAGRLADAVNDIAARNQRFVGELAEVHEALDDADHFTGRLVGEIGPGGWAVAAESVNGMIEDLAKPMIELGRVLAAAAEGDLSQRMSVEGWDPQRRVRLRGLSRTVNGLLEQLALFADEVTRVAREVGSEGRLGGQARVPGVAGTWRDLTDSVNFMAGNLTSQVRNIAQVATAVAQGDLTQKISVDVKGEMLELKNTLNTMVDQLSGFADEVTRVAREVGGEGRLGGQARVPGVAGTWRDLTDSVNFMAGNLTSQVRNIAQVATAVAKGDLAQKITVEARGEVAALSETLNGMVDTLRAFADEVTRVAREVGTEGKLGGQAQVRGVSGTWKDLTDHVNSMAGNLTGQVRNIAQVTTAVAQGDLSRKIDVDARGEILELKTTINTMVDRLSAFASEVTRVAREVGTEGKLGGQAEVMGVSGTWQQLTENVNQLASNLTTQVRAIAVVATAVTAGDLTRQITVEAEGEVADLKDNINQMIANLSETTTANQEQYWLKTNVARLSALMQGTRDLTAVASLILGELSPLVVAQQGAFFLATDDVTEGTVLELTASYAYRPPNGTIMRFRLGESLVGQVAVDKRTMLVNGAPGDYLSISSGLGSAPTVTLVLVPVLFEGQVLGVIELASVSEFTTVHLDLLDQLKETIGTTINTILVHSRTDALLAESRRLAGELQSRQVELQRSNTELAEKARLLAQQNSDIEAKNIEIDAGRQELEERARQLAIASKYKSEFMANMSHELRTPLNSLLVLAKLLADNGDGNLTAKQTEFARTIHSAGFDLLQLINDILDLAKVEAGHLQLDTAPVSMDGLVGYVETLCRPLATEKNLAFTVVVAQDTPPVLFTDEQRLQQVLRNLLSNAVKFTQEGKIQLDVRAAAADEVRGGRLRRAFGRVAFVVRDTGIGIAQDKLAVIFEAFQQADGTTSRKYGGTGLGLSISRELADLLDGELHVRSTPGEGSTFTLYLPVRHSADLSVRPPAAPLNGQLASTSYTGPDSANVATVTSGVNGQDTSTWPPAVSSGTLGASRFHGEQVLIVDDDLRNVLALSAVLEAHGLRVVSADNGVAGVRALEQHADIAVVLMDIMMPELDGNATMEAIRSMAGYADLPIVAVTAKAMQGDREKSLASGATDYVTKPVDTEYLLDLLSGYLTEDSRIGPVENQVIER